MAQIWFLVLYFQSSRKLHQIHVTILKKSYSLKTATVFYTWGPDGLGYFIYPYCTKHVTVHSQAINEEVEISNIPKT